MTLAGLRHAPIMTPDDGMSNIADWTYWPLLNEIGRWGVNGVDLGANTRHNKRLYIWTSKSPRRKAEISSSCAA